MMREVLPMEFQPAPKCCLRGTGELLLGFEELPVAHELLTGWRHPPGETPKVCWPSCHKVLLICTGPDDRRAPVQGSFWTCSSGQLAVRELQASACCRPFQGCAADLLSQLKPLLSWKLVLQII